MLGPVILIVQICLAPAAGGGMLEGCRHRTIDADTCENAIAIVASTLAPDRVAVAAGCVPVIPSNREAGPRIAATGNRRTGR